MDFAIAGDKDYFETMCLNISQIQKLHPDAKIFVGDLGLTDSQHTELIEKYVHVIPLYKGYNHRWFKMAMKPLFLLQVFSESKNLICLMDADCVLMQRLEFEITKDAIVTVRNSRHGRINSGVVITETPEFASHWLSRTIAKHDHCRDELSEQNALIDLCDSGDFQIHEVPCSVYNYSAVETGISDEVKIVHLKSGRHRDERLLQEVRAKSGASIV